MEIDRKHLKQDEVKLLQAEQAATPGPWIGWGISNDTASLPEPHGWVIGWTEVSADKTKYISPSDAGFVASSRNMVEPLLRRLAELRAENERLRELTSQTADVLQAILDSGYAENRGLIVMRIERLREQIHRKDQT